uniref:Ovule protein n=1 Tax=Ditylenchus dipsaci TaxID=166011 RepID=A0A915CNW6_9BILA
MLASKSTNYLHFQTTVNFRQIGGCYTSLFVNSIHHNPLRSNQKKVEKNSPLHTTYIFCSVNLLHSLDSKQIHFSTIIPPFSTKIIIMKRSKVDKQSTFTSMYAVSYYHHQCLPYPYQ